MINKLKMILNKDLLMSTAKVKMFNKRNLNFKLLHINNYKL